MRETLVNKINWQKCNNLIPAIVQDEKTLEILMLGFMNQEALRLSEETKKVHFWSRTKNRIWMKGEESGNVLNLVEMFLDCDNDSLLIFANPTGNTCHNGTKSCFNGRGSFLADLEGIIKDRIQNPRQGSYISKLTQRGVNKVAQKIGEEASEVIIAGLSEADDLFLGECADLLFHMILFLNVKGLAIYDVIQVLKMRHASKKINDE